MDAKFITAVAVALAALLAAGPVALWIGKFWRYGTLRAERQFELDNPKKKDFNDGRT